MSTEANVVSINPALEDLKKIADRPELTQEEWGVVDKASDWLKAVQRPEVRKELEEEYTARREAFEEQLRTETSETIKTMMDDWKKEQEPLSEAELTKLLSQEYLEFPLIIKVRGEEKARNFTIVELSGESEKKFLVSAQKRLIPMLETANAAEFKLDGTVTDSINEVLEALPSALEIAAELVSICLNPFGEDKTLDADWVMKNVSSYRMGAIIMCQAEANRYRDFFSDAFRQFRTLKKKT